MTSKPTRVVALMLALAAALPIAACTRGNDGGPDPAPDAGPARDANLPDAAEHDAGYIEPMSCARLTVPAHEAQLDLFMMLDSSGSMEGGPWTQVTFAFQHLLQNPLYDGIGVGLHYFPEVASSSDVCGSGDVMDYTTPELPIAPLPGSYDAIVRSLTTRETRGNTPTCAAFDGAYAYVTGWKAAHPSHQVAMLFITDGLPTRPDDMMCGSIGCAVNDVTTRARATAGGPVRVYFIGYPGATSLPAWASAAGTAPPFELSGSAPQELIDAIHAIRTMSELPCTYEVPMPEGERNIDPATLNVRVSYSPGDAPATIPKSTACDTRGGWHYDDEAHPSRVELCPATCRQVERAGANASIDIVIGCETILI